MPDRVLTPKQQEEAFTIMGDVTNLDADRICRLFGRFLDKETKKSEVRFFLDDIITISSKDSPFVKDGSVTTLGIYITNKFLIEDLKIFGYINKPFNKSVHGKINDAMASAMPMGDITPQQFANYIDRCQYLFGGPLSFIVGTSVSETLLTLPKRLHTLLDEHRPELQANDPQVAAHIEKEVVTVALGEMRKKDDPAMALFDSGCGVDPYNNYKTICVMKGAIVDNTGSPPLDIRWSPLITILVSRKRICRRLPIRLLHLRIPLALLHRILVQTARNITPCSRMFGCRPVGLIVGQNNT